MVRETADRVRDWLTSAASPGVYEPEAARIDKALRLGLTPSP